MTPREAADRLFNRIMTAAENGNLEEARRFAPMGIDAYRVLPAQDRDTLFHLGLIHGVAGNEAEVARAIAAMRDGAPNHLLALFLLYEAAKRTGDLAAADRAVLAFAAAYPIESAQPRPEYEAHRGTIERFMEGAGR